jgi:hypothetical protein
MERKPQEIQKSSKMIQNLATFFDLKWNTDSNFKKHKKCSENQNFFKFLYLNCQNYFQGIFRNIGFSRIMKAPLKVFSVIRKIFSFFRGLLQGKKEMIYYE